jgi:hypothetical protein
LGGLPWLISVLKIHGGIQFQFRLWETTDMKAPELMDVGWLGPRIEMDDASHRFGKCSECHEIICVEKVVTDAESTQTETTEMLYRVFRAHLALKHAQSMGRSAA